MMDILNYEKEQVLKFYNEGAEIGRLERGIGKVEYERTKEILLRYLPPKKQIIYDIGGGIGVYSSWLASLGHEVHLFELAPKAVEYAKELNKGKINPINTIEVADARNIERPNDSADIVLLMGPLYHLTQIEDRLKSLKEASRVLKKNGLIIVSAISRFSSTLWGLSVFGQYNDFINDNVFFEMIESELTDGQHIRPEKYNKFIARAFFHTPKELKQEIESVGLIHEKTLAIEGPVWIVPSFDEKWEQEESKERLLKICQKVEEQESLMGMSPHILAVGRKLSF
jgi:SAM-dependent methyltransferase